MGSKRKTFSIVALGVAVGVGCGASMRPFPLAQPMWNDPDRRPFAQKPEEYESPFAWDAADQTVFRPISRFFAVDPADEAINVNALDEVPDSSWFTNRIGMHDMTVEQVAMGPCGGVAPLDPEGPWTVTGAKPSGANPGFVIEDAQGRTFLLKFDGLRQPERATTADVVVSRMYWSAGYFTPCNSIVYFDRRILRMGEDAESEDDAGRDVPMTRAHIDQVLSQGVRLDDGRYRASASLYLDGEPLGPWTYQGTRDDDPNDVVPHEDRRDLRGMYVLASWVNHFDSREQNTLATWIEAENGRGGYVRHNVLDFGDSFGSLWDYEGISRRLGHAYYLDLPYLLEDFATLGIVERPWDRARFGRAGEVLGYFDSERFVPDEWRPGYPNPAMARMSERDAAWMARIVARFDERHVRALVDQAQIQDDVVREELVRILLARRARLLRRWFGNVSPLTAPEVRSVRGEAALCLEDRAVSAEVARREGRSYFARAWVGTDPQPSRVAWVRPAGEAHVCAALPAANGASRARPGYVIVDVRSRELPARVHLYHLGGESYRVVGLERPYDTDPPE